MTHEDIVLSSIYEEMKQANVNVYYAELVRDRHIKRNKVFGTAVTCFSVGGAALSFVNTVFPIAVCFLLALAQTLKTFFPCLMLNMEEISKLSSLSVEYDIYFQKIKKIHDDLFSDIIDSKKANNTFLGLVKDNAYNKNEISRLFGTIDEKLNIIAANKSDNFLNTIYHGKENINN